jgi:hypothetical protein
MTAKDLTKQAVATYRMLRLGLAVLAFAFPILLGAGGHFAGHLPLAGSMSAYYHASDPLHPDDGAPGQGVMRNEFVGILFAVGMLLLVYQGFSPIEDWALNLAGVMAFGIALCPMKWPAGPHDSLFSFHGLFAISFFACIAYVCIWRAADSLSLVKDVPTFEMYRRTYKWLGRAMAICPVIAWVLISHLPIHATTIFFVECVGIYVFATYWVVKSHEASKTKLDEKAIRGEVRAQPQGLSHIFRELPLTVQ